jgi:hypothetical protein
LIEAVADGLHRRKRSTEHRDIDGHPLAQAVIGAWCASQNDLIHDAMIVLKKVPNAPEQAELAVNIDGD